jgi:hypothetical protein
MFKRNLDICKSVLRQINKLHLKTNFRALQFIVKELFEGFEMSQFEGFYSEEELALFQRIMEEDV